MAARLVKVVSPEVTLTSSGTAYYPVQVIAPSDQDIRVLKLRVSSEGTSGTDAQALWEVLRTTGGTFTSLTPVKHNNAWSGTLRTTAGHTASVNPTGGDVLERGYYHNQIGLEFSFADNPIVVSAGTHLTVKITPGTSGRKVVVVMLVEE